MRKIVALATLLSAGFVMAQPSAAGLIKAFPDASTESKITILRFLSANKTPEALPVYMEYLGFGLNKVTVNPDVKNLAPEVREWSAKGMASLKDQIGRAHV